MAPQAESAKATPRALPPVETPPAIFMGKPKGVLMEATVVRNELMTRMSGFERCADKH